MKVAGIRELCAQSAALRDGDEPVIGHEAWTDIRRLLPLHPHGLDKRATGNDELTPPPAFRYDEGCSNRACGAVGSAHDWQS